MFLRNADMNYITTPYQVHTRPDSLLAEVFFFKKKKMGFCLFLHSFAYYLTTLTVT
jgi:hypothetical protein